MSGLGRTTLGWGRCAHPVRNLRIVDHKSGRDLRSLRQGFLDMARKLCVICGQCFEARGNAKACSPEHSKAREKARPRRERAQPNKAWARQCVVCDKTFYTTTGTKTCSPEHWREHLRAVRRAAVRRYQQSEKGQQARLRYEQSEKRRQTRQHYHQSEQYREARLRYEQSEKGQELRLRRSKVKSRIGSGSR